MAETASNDYFTWDTLKYRTCVCDKGWEGIDCNLRQCNMGVERVSDSSIDYKYTFKLTTTNFGGDLKDKDFYFKYTYDGVEYESTNVKARDLTDYCKTANDKIDTAFATEYAEEIRRSIRLINPLSQSTVSVSCSGKDDKKLVITVDAKYLDVDQYCKGGDTFKIITDNKANTVISSSKLNGSQDQCDKGKKPTQSLCSGRGLCNTELGLCECFTGYYGAACENQLSIAI